MTVTWPTIEGPAVPVRNFGAVGNGVVDDTAALQAGINSCAANGVRLKLGKGIFKITGALNVSAGTVIEGEHPSSTQILFDNATDNFIYGDGCHNFAIRRVYFKRTGTGVSFKYGIHILNAQDILVEDCWFMMTCTASLRLVDCDRPVWRGGKSMGDPVLGGGYGALFDGCANLLVQGVTFSDMLWVAHLGNDTEWEITSITFSGTTATATTFRAHDLLVGGTTTIRGATDPLYNGTFTIVSKPDNFSFTYTMSGTPAANAVGSPYLMATMRVPGTSDHISKRPYTLTAGGRFIGCTFERPRGHGFVLNGCVASGCSDCVVKDYDWQNDNSGTVPYRAAFQIKQSSGDNAEANYFDSCRAYNVGSGFLCQEGTRAQITNCAVYGARFHGVQFNSCPASALINFVGMDVGRLAVWIEASAATIVNGVNVKKPQVLQHPGFAVSSSNPAGDVSYCLYIRNSTVCSINGVMQGGQDKYALIDSLSGRNWFGMNNYTNGLAIEDAVTTTLYPVVASAELNVAVGAGTDFAILAAPTGIDVCRISFFTTIAITGTTPTIQVGRAGATTVLLAAQSPGVAQGNISHFTLATTPALVTTFLAASNCVVARTNGVATAGKVLVTIHGLWRP